jgi:hypothetical protein
MLLSTIRFWLLGWIETHYLAPKIHFKYYGFEWVEVISPTFIYALHILMLLAAFCVMIGLWYRVAAIILFLTFTYTQLIDLTYYLNHYYFVSLVCFLLIFVPANRYFSVDVWQKPELQKTVVPKWTIWIFQAQIAFVYIYAGIAKINYTWLFEALPLKIWLPANDQLFLIGKLFTLKITPYLFSWVGMLYDCFIIFFLLWRKTRIWAYLLVIIFHALTGLLFQIGVFPLVMIGVTLIFFSPQWHYKLLATLAKITKIKTIKFDFAKPLLQQKISLFTKISLGVYFTFQILFPFRYLFYEGNMFWTEQGYRFGWRVMLMEKAGTATFYVKDSQTQKEGEVVNSEFLTAEQEKQMAMQPDLILQFAHYLAKYYEKKGVKNPQVRAEVYVTLNGKPSQLLIKPQLDLTKIKDSWAEKTWILKNKER